MKKKLFLALLVCTLCFSTFCSMVRPSDEPGNENVTADSEGPEQAGNQPVEQPKGPAEPLNVPEVNPDPSAVKTVTPKKIISQKEFSIETAIDLEGFKGVELWYTLDNGANWLLSGTFEGRPKTLKFSAPKDGYYGFLQIPIDEYNKRAYTPKSGTKPDLTVLVDTTLPVVVVEAPNGGNIFKNEGYELIKWNAMDANMAPLPVAIEVSSDSGKTWSRLAENEPNTGQYIWKVPAISSSRYRVRVIARDQAGLSGSDESDNDFSIDGLAPDAVILSPAKSRLNDVELQYKVEDVGGAGISTVELWFTKDNGATWERYGEDKNCVSPFKFAAVDGSYGLKLVAADRVGNTSAIPSAGTRPQFNMIVDSQKPQVKLLSFLDVNRLYSGNYTYPVMWLARDDNLVDNCITLEFSDDGGSTWQSMPQAINVSNDVQPYNWKLPNKLGKTYKIRVTARDLLDNIGVSESPLFAVDPFTPEIKITDIKPNTPGGVPVEYQFVNAGIAPVKKVFVWYTKDNGFSWHKYAEDEDKQSPVIVNLSDGDYGIVLTCVTELGEETGRITPAPKKGDMPDKVISIDLTPPKVELRSFIGGNIFKGGEKAEIAWNAVDPHLLENCFIEISSDSGMHWKLLADKIPAVLGKYTWQLPVETDTCYRVRVVVSDKYDNIAKAESAADFSIDSSAPVCEAIAPETATAKGFSVIYKASEVGPAGLNEVRLFMSRIIDGKVIEWKEYANTREHPFVFKVSVDSDGVYGFKVIATDRVGNASQYPSAATPPDSRTFVDSTPPSVQLITMRGTDIFKGGSVQKIRFRARDNYSGDLQFSIYYSGNEGKLWNKIANNLNIPVDADNIYTYSWILPEETGDYFRVRVEAKDSCDNIKTSESDTNFSIDSSAPTASLTGPGISQNQTVQLSYTAKDTGKSGVKFMSLYFRPAGEKEYRKYKDFTEANPVIAFIAPDGRYEMFLTCEDGAGNRLPAPDRETTPQLQLTIDSKAPGIKLLTLTGGEIIGGSEKALIRWEAVDENPVQFFMTIEASFNGGKTWSVLAAQQKDTGYFEWTLPRDMNSSECKVRVSTADAVGIRGEAVSPGNFIIDTSAPVIKALEPTVATSRPVMVKFFADDKGPAGLKTIDAYISNNDGRTWEVIASVSSADVRDSMLPLNLPEGRFAVYLSATDKAGNRSVLPRTDQPQLFILVDTVKPRLTFKGIDSGNIYRGTSVVSLSWEVADDNPAARPVSLRWSMDMGKSWNIIAENLLPKDKFDWKLPDKSGRYALSVRAADSAGNIEEMAIPFALDSLPPFLKTIGDIKGTFRGGDTVEIQWQASDDNFSDKPVALMFSPDNGKQWEYIEKEIPNSGRYIWQIKPVTSPECLLQLIVTDKTGNRVEKTFAFAVDSDAPICRLKGPVFSTSQAVTLAYESSDSGKAGIAGYSLYFRGRGEREYRKYKDYAGPEPVITFTAKDGVYDMFLACKDNAGNETIIPPSDAAAQLQLVIDSEPPRVMLMSFLGGEITGKAQKAFIQWSANDNLLEELIIKIEFSSDAGKTWAVLADNLKNTGVYEWVVPNNINSSECKIKVTASTTMGSHGESMTPGVFIIDTVEPVIKAVGPETTNVRPAFVLCQAEDKGPAGIESVDVYYSKNMGKSWDLLRTALYAEVKDNAVQIPLSDGKYSIFLSARDKAGNQSQAPANGFKPQVILTIDWQKPELRSFKGIANGDVLHGGSIAELSWFVEDQNMPVDPVSISFSADEGKNWKALNENQPAIGKLEWQIPDRSGKYVLNIRSKDIAGNINLSQVMFTVDNEPPAVKIATGISGILRGGDSRELRWEAVDENMPEKPVSIMLSKDNGRSYEYVEKDMPNSGYYPWLVPAVTSSACKLKLSVMDKVGNKKEVEFAANTFSIDSSPPTVNILDVVVLESEGALVKYQAEDVGNAGVDSVKIYVTENGGQRWVRLDEQKGRGTEFKLKLGTGVYGIYLVARDKAGNQSPADEPGYGSRPQRVFEIKTGEQRIVFEGLFAGATYEAGSLLKFSWVVNGVADPVRVKLDFLRQDMEQEWEKSVSGLKAKSDFSIKLSPVPGKYAIRLTAYDNTTELVARTVVFETKEKEAPPSSGISDTELIKLISPVHDGAYRAGSKLEIRWQGNEEFLKPKSAQLEYSLDDGKNWIIIDHNLEITSSLVWTAPLKDSFACRIRVKALTITDKPVIDEIPASIRIDMEPPKAELKFNKKEPQEPKKEPDESAPRTASEFHERGMKYYKGGNYEMAAQFFKKALEIEPDNSDIRNDLCATYMVAGDYTKAAAELEISIMQKETAKNRFNLGLIHGYQKNYAKAKEQLGRAVELAPERIDYIWELAVTCRKLKDFGEAKAYFEKIIEIEPNSSFAAKAKKELETLK